MARFLWACFDGGGNVPPSLGIARALVDGGHDVCFAGRPEMLDRVRSGGFRAIEVTQAYASADIYAWHPRARLFCYLTSPAVGEELVSIAAAEEPDVVIIDAMFGAALAVAPRFGVPTAVMLHTFLHRTLDGWHVMMREQSEARRGCGFDPLPTLDEMWGGRELLQVNSLEQFDSAPRVWWKNVRHGGPVVEDDGQPDALDPWRGSGDDSPLVLISFSTEPVQGSVGKLQRALDACAGLPIRVVATTGGAVDPAALSVPDNARAVRAAAHGPLMSRAALVITHGGHGTAMRALNHGLPMICVTGQASDQQAVAALDQPCVAAFVEEYGLGRQLSADAPVAQIRAAVREVLGDPGYRRNARRLSERLRAGQGAAEAASRLEALACRVAV